jgi:hypothetical protein
MPIYQKNRLLASLNRDWLDRYELFSSKAATGYLSGLSRTVDEFSIIHDADIRTLVEMEILALEHEMELYGEEDKTVMPTLQSAINSLNHDVIGAITTASIPEYYQKAALTHSSKRQYHGVPADGCHEALNSHITRLENRIRTVGVPMAEKRILIARKENMKQAKQLYVILQQMALGITIQVKSAKQKGSGKH